MKAAVNLLEATRVSLESDVAAAALRVHLLERKLAELKELGTLVGYDLCSARLDLRRAVEQLETHNVRRTEARS